MAGLMFGNWERTGGEAIGGHRVLLLFHSYVICVLIYLCIYVQLPKILSLFYKGFHSRTV